MTRLRVSGPARRDISSALRRSAASFGRDAQSRYRVLFVQAFDDLRADPVRPGAKRIDDVRAGYCAYHVKWSVGNVPGPTVRRPRHVIVYYVEPTGDLLVARVLRDMQLLEHHLQ